MGNKIDFELDMASFFNFHRSCEFNENNISGELNSFPNYPILVCVRYEIFHLKRTGLSLSIFNLMDIRIIISFQLVVIGSFIANIS